MRDKLSNINDLAFELQHDDELTAEQFWKVKQIFELSVQYQLNENQQKYLKELQYNRERLGNTHDALFFGLVDYEKRWNFNDENFAQVLQIFSQRALEQEEELWPKKQTS